MDEKISELTGNYKQLQAEFTAIHQNVEMLRQESMKPAQLKKEIEQLNSEKEQLMTKINMFKDKNQEKDFLNLLEATSTLRKE